MLCSVHKVPVTKPVKPGNEQLAVQPGNEQPAVQPGNEQLPVQPGNQCSPGAGDINCFATSIILTNP